MDNLNIKFVDLSGYAVTGKSAVIELMQEFDGYFNAGRDVEFELCRVRNGLRDLENALVNSWNPSGATLAVRKFFDLIDGMGASPKLRNLYGQYNSFATKYDDKFHNQFSTLAKEYAKSLVSFHFKSQVPHPYLFRSRMEFFIDRILLKTGLRETYSLEDIFMTVPPDEFYRLTRRFLDTLFNQHNLFNGESKLCSSISKYERYNTFVLSNAAEPFCSSKTLNLFNDCRQIIVDRDPRDIYLSVKQDDDHAGKKHFSVSGEEDIKIFVERYRYLRQRTEPISETDKNRKIIMFEDLVINYEKTVLSILEFLQEDTSIHIHKKKFFDPKCSVKSVGMWRNIQNSSEVEYITKELPEYCRDL